MKMSIRTCSAAVLAIIAVSVSCTPRPRMEGPRGVILISLDTLRADHLGCYGYERPTSPFIDEIAGRGVLFERAIVQLPGTLPSHMSMLTGLLPAEHDVFPPDGVLSEEIKLLPELLSTAGIRTAGFTEGGYMSGRYGFARGFERFDDSSRKLNTDIEAIFRKGLGFVDALPADERFFLFLHTYAVHDPYFPPPPYCARYLENGDRSAIEGFADYAGEGLVDETPEYLEAMEQRFRRARDFLEANLPDGAPMPTGPELVKLNRAGGDTVSAEVVEFYEALYDGSINYVDDVLRAVFARLESSGLGESTVVILTSDHGEEFHEHGRFAHTQIYDECLHVPLIVVGPGVAEGRRIAELVMSIDLTPTILDLFGLATGAPSSGRSLRPVLSEPSSPPAPRDAYAVGFEVTGQSLYRAIDGEARQLVVQDKTIPEEGLWVSRQVTLETIEPELRFTATSYHEPRRVDLIIDGAVANSLELLPEWKSYTVPLPSGVGKHTITLSSDTCVAPASLGESADSRCLAFCLRDYPNRRIELFNLDRDPAAATDLSTRQPETLRQLMAGLPAFARDPVARAGTEPLDEATRQRLEELGYLDPE